MKGVRKIKIVAIGKADPSMFFLTVRMPATGQIYQFNKPAAWDLLQKLKQDGSLSRASAKMVEELTAAFTKEGIAV